MNIRWRHWWDVNQNISWKGGPVTHRTLHVAGLLGEKAYGISVQAEVRFEKQYLEAAKGIIANKLH
jgi:hypothetical protein